MSVPPVGQQPLLQRPTESNVWQVMFFLFGAASDITFNSIVLSVAFLRQELGPDVLIRLGRAQFWGSGTAMLSLFFWGLLNPGGMVGEIRLKTGFMALAMVYMLVVDLGLILCALNGWPLDATVTQLAVLLNGVATGSTQSLGALLAGMMNKFGGHPKSTAAQVSGVGFGIVLPTAVQFAFLGSRVSAARLALLCYALAASVVLGGLGALLYFRRTEEYRRAAGGGIDDLSGTEGLGAMCQCKWSWWVRRRITHTRICCVGLLVNFAGGVYLGLLSPLIPSRGDVPAAFRLPTVLLGTANACDFGGRIFAFRSSSETARRMLSSLPTIFALLAARLAIAAGCLGYSLAPPEGALGGPSSLLGNAPVILLYGLGAVLGGTVTVSLTNVAQRVCMKHAGPNMDQESEMPCPLAGQILFLACLAGSMAGAVLPFP